MIMDPLLEQCLDDSDGESSYMDIIEPGLCSQNKYSMLNSQVGDGDGWLNGQRQRRHKRRRENSGSVDLDIFSSMNSEEKLNALFTKMTNVEQSQNACNRRLSAIIETAHNKVKRLEEHSSKHDEQLKILTYKSIDIEARSRRNNLIFHGLADVVNENSKDIVNQFLANELEIDPLWAPIDRAHRLGPRVRVRSGPSATRRPLIAAFSSYPDTERILDKAKSLRGTGFWIERDMPTEIRNARKTLWPEYKEYKRNERNRVSIVYPAKLVVNSRVVKDLFPGWSECLKTNRMELLQRDPCVNRENRGNSELDMQCDLSRESRSTPSISVTATSTTTTSSTTSSFRNTTRKQMSENTKPRDSNTGSAGQLSQSESDMSQCSQSLLQPQRQAGNTETKQNKPAPKRKVNKPTSHSNPKKRVSVKATPKVKPVANPRPGRRANTQRSSLNVNQPINEEQIINTQTNDSQREIHEQNPPCQTQTTGK